MHEAGEERELFPGQAGVYLIAVYLLGETSITPTLDENRMSEAHTTDLLYGHVGNAIYDGDRKKWHFTREPRIS